tara:strand:- start:7723 stop:9609 length:1887 start_codon:yes stop_codon:yes gene_type:complete
MNFFESQDVARRNTRFLIFLFFLAVLSLVLLTNLLVLVMINYGDTGAVTGAVMKEQLNYSWQLFGAVSLGVVGLIGIASLIRLQMLKRGGSVIAEMMDGVLLVNPGDDHNKQKLLNCVAEMAIASSIPVPPVYLIQDPAINAFAAGYSSGDAVIGITTGAIENLNREQLQGVIAHEFSHILNGDMRLNIRLIGILHGILVLALAGRMILYSGNRRSRNKDQAGLLALGIGLLVIGYLGRFFGNLIKAAVSRQREYLADASAVQFTRNADGIAGALKRIGGYETGSIVENPESEELSHAFFSQGVKFMLGGLFATHPDLEDRIQRIEPRWSGEFLNETVPESQGEEDGQEQVMGFASKGIKVDPEVVVSQVGNPDAGHLLLARRLIGSIPNKFRDAANEPYSARALVYLMLLDEDEDVRKIQLDHLRDTADLFVFDSLEALLDDRSDLRREMRLPILELSMPTLRQLTYQQYQLFMANIKVLIEADKRISLSEWCLQKYLSKHLNEVYENAHGEPKYGNIGRLKAHCAVLLSMLAYCDRKSTVAPVDAFSMGSKELGLPITLLEKSQLNFGKLNAAVNALADLHPLKKPKLLKACIRTIAADGLISVAEAELVRTIADSLDCPIPPISA